MGVVQKLHQHSDRYSRMQLALTHGQARAHAEHCAIVRAARRRDVRSAESLLRKHIQGAGRALVEFLRAQQADAASPRRAQHA
jgi:DNA-binding GntR family transcriptional regulator